MAFQRAKALKEAENSATQGKIAQAIKQYQNILDNDSSDLSLLNTIGDLYIAQAKRESGSLRDRNITEGISQFRRLAEAYVRDGFNVKAIAIYRKIRNLDPNSVDTLLKLAELYQLQGLSREAREQYLQAAEFFKKRNQIDRALETLRKLVQLDPENLTFRTRLATECEQMGRRDDAAQVYLESAEILLRHDDKGGAENALKKGAELSPKNSKILILRARVAIARQQPEEAENIINSSPELQSDPAGKRILLDSYLAARKLPQAQMLVLEVFHTNPVDFAPVSSVSALLVEKGDIEEAYQLLAGEAEQMISLNDAGPLLEALRRIWNKAPKHIPTLELIHRVCERTANELILPEVLEALGSVHEEAGDLEKAEAAYLKLTTREPENENYRALLNAVQRKLGRELEPVDFTAKEITLSAATAEELPSEPEAMDVDQEAMVKEALENSDLFARYNLPEKAIAELEKALQVYPDQVDIHRRILEISCKGFPERVTAAAAQLARIFTEHGDHELASKYQAIVSAKGALPEIPLPPPPPVKKVEEPAPPQPAPPESPEIEKVSEFSILPITPEEPVTAAAAPPREVASFEFIPPEAPAAPPLPPTQGDQTMELDLSGELEAIGFAAPAPSVPEPVAPPPVEIPLTAETPASTAEPAPPPIQEKAAPSVEVPAEVPEPPPPPEEETIPVDLEESRIEIDFYLENGFVNEAQQTVAELEEKYPGSPFVAELRSLLDERAAEAPPAEPQTNAVQTDEAVAPEPAEEFELVDEAPFGEPPIEVVPTEAEVVQAEPEVAPPPEPAPLEEEPAQEEWELPTSYAVTPQPEPAKQPVVPPPLLEPEAPRKVAKFAPPPREHEEPSGEEAFSAEDGGMDMLGDLAADFASSLDGLTAPLDASRAAPAAPPKAAGPPPAGPAQGAAQLSGLLAEMEGPGAAAAAAAKDDPETHYNLGVAFREMGLLDESIGEFQKVVKGAGRGNFPANFLQACSLLAICFMEKRMPAIAIKWYLRALETPGLDEEALMALQYDLGLAYEQAGDPRSALERFTEVYSQNIDFRDVAEKIRDLQQ
jgi:tetratricopeptide (TPR) repeat protein